MWKGGRAGTPDSLHSPEDRQSGHLGEMGTLMLDHKRMYQHCIYKAHLRLLLRRMGMLR